MRRDELKSIDITIDALKKLYEASKKQYESAIEHSGIRKGMPFYVISIRSTNEILEEYIRQFEEYKNYKKK